MKTLVIALVALAAVPAARAAAQPVVPTFTQHQIATRTSQLAYVPARMASGYRYFRWTFTGGVLRIWFRNPARREIVFVAAKQKGSCIAGRQKTFQMGGNKVYWAKTSNEQRAWRCLDGVRLVAATSQPPTQFADVGLGRVAASGHRIR